MKSSLIAAVTLPIQGLLWLGTNALGAEVNFWDEIPVSPSTLMPLQVQDDYWSGQFQRVNREVSQAKQTAMVFFGDSITGIWSLGSTKGQEVWQENYARYHPINMGNSGDITPVMLYRVTHGNLDFAAGKHPKVAVLLCGVNNFMVTQSDGGKETGIGGQVSSRGHCSGETGDCSSVPPALADDPPDPPGDPTLGR